MAIHLGIITIHSQELLQVPSQGNTAPKTISMDLEIQMLQQIKSILMVTLNGQTQYSKYAKKEKIQT